jgi:hypothetical protein
MSPRRLFARLHRDGLVMAEIHYRGRSHQFDAAARPVAPLRLIALGGASLAALALAFGLLTHRPAPIAVKPVSPPPAALPASAYGELVRLVTEADSAAVAGYLERHQYRDDADEYGWSALHWAAFNGNHAMYQALVKAGAAPDKPSTQAWFTWPAGTTPGQMLQ